MSFKPFIISLALATAAFSAPTFALDATMVRIKATKSINLGYRASSAPFSSVGAGGADGAGRAPQGYSIELCKRAAQSVQSALKLPDLKMKWVAVTAENRFTMLKNGKIDIECGVTTNTLARQREFDFSLMTFADGANLLSKSESGIDSLAKTAGKKIGIVGNTTTESAIKAALAKRSISAQVVSIKDHAEGLAALKSGAVDAYAADQVVLMGLAGGDAKAYRLGADLLSYEPYGLMMRAAQRDLKLAVDTALARLYRDSAIVALYSTHFGAFGEPSLLLQAMYSLNGLPD